MVYLLLRSAWAHAVYTSSKSASIVQIGESMHHRGTAGESTAGILSEQTKGKSRRQIAGECEYMCEHRGAIEQSERWQV